MVRESGISATKPIFPTYLLPSFKLPFRRRHSASSSSSSSSSEVDGDSAASSAATTPANSPPKEKHLVRPARGTRLARVAPNTLRCSSCSADIAFSSQIVSKGFTGRYGRAFLVSPLPPPAEQSLLNIRLGRNEERQLVTGWHTVADITCSTCASKLGWKYVDAREPAQKYKIGKFILETERVVTFRSWEDVDERADKAGPAPSKVKGEEEDEVVFDSDDEDECEDVFAGTWDAGTVAKRRSRMAALGQVKPA